MKIKQLSAYDLFNSQNRILPLFARLHFQFTE
jgi:hypothetical protein